MSHPSLFTLVQFTDAGCPLDPPDVEHLRGCGSCAASLQRLAQRELRRRGLKVELPSASLHARAPAFAALMAAVTMLVVLVTSHSAVQVARMDSVVALAPEGRHGVPSEGPTDFRHPSVTWDGDAGEQLGSR